MCFSQTLAFESAALSRAKSASEWAGDVAGSVVDAQLGRTPVLGAPAAELADHMATGAGRLDRVAIGEDGASLVIGENKAGKTPGFGWRGQGVGVAAGAHVKAVLDRVCVGIGECLRLGRCGPESSKVVWGTRFDAVWRTRSVGGV